MKKSIIIVGMGPGLSLGVAEKFGAEDFAIGMISRSEDKLLVFQKQLSSQGMESHYEQADVADTQQLLGALRGLKQKLGRVDVLHYNAVDYRMKPLLDETVEDLANGFKISVAHALASAKELLPELKKNQGSVLLTGGATATQPNSDMASISLGKAGIRNLALQLHAVLKKEGVFVGTVTIGGWIQPNSATHSPKILAEKFWALNAQRNTVEVVY